MKKGIVIGMLIGTWLLTSTLPTPALAGRGRGSGNMRGNTLHTQTQTRQRLRDGSCLGNTGNQAGKKKKQGNTYGPGDGTGNSGAGPQDGTGYGAPSQR